MHPSTSGSKVFRVLFLVLFFVLIQSLPVQGQQNQEISSAGIEKLLQDLEDPAKLQELKQDLRTLLAAREAGRMPSLKDPQPEPRGIAGHFLETMSGHTQVASQMLADAGRNILQVPSLLKDLVEQAQDPEVLRTWAEMAGKIALVLLAGFMAQWLAHRLTAKTRRRLEDQEAHHKGIRALHLLGSTLVELVPIAAFAIAAYGILPLLDPREGTQLVALTLINAFVLVRIILALARLVLVPGNASLRLLPLDNESVQYLYIWVRRIAGLGVYGYFILEAALLLGLPDSLYFFFLKFLGLLITLMTVILVLQNRSAVAGWLHGPQKEHEAEAGLPAQDSPGAIQSRLMAVGALRRKIAGYWHIAAVLLILAMFATWALEIEGGLFFLARGVITTILVIALALLTIRLVMQGMDRLFKISEELKEKYPDLEARANRYLPVLRQTVKGVIWLVAVFSIFQAWGLGTLSWLFSHQGQSIVSNILIIALIVSGALLIWELVNARIESSLSREREDKKGSTRKLTLLPLLRNVIMIGLILVAGMSVLSHLGINIAPLLAGAGVIGLAIGFGAQTLVRDVITGAFILIEDSIAVGDWVEAGGHAGTVEHLTVRTVTLRDLTGTVHVVPFGDVTSVLNYNRDYGYALIDAGVAYRENYGEVVQALQDVSVELREDETWGPEVMGDLEVFGLNSLSDSAVEIRVRMKTRPMRQFAVRRAFQERMKRVFDERGIEIPFPHRTIWFGTDKDGTAPPMRVLQETRKRSQAVEEGKSSESMPEHRIEYFTEADASKEVVREKEQGEEELEKQEKESQEQKDRPRGETDSTG